MRSRGHGALLLRRLGRALGPRAGLGLPLGHWRRAAGAGARPGPGAGAGHRRRLGLGPARRAGLGGGAAAGARAGARLGAAVARAAAGAGPAATPGARSAAAARAAAPPAVAAAPVPAGRRAAAAVVRVGRAAVARHLHPQLAPVQHGAVHGVHGVLGVALVVEAHEGEAAGLLGVAVPRDVHVAHAPVLLEDAPQRVGRGAVGQVVHLEGGHALHIGRRAAVAHGSEAARGPANWRRDSNGLGGPARCRQAAVFSGPGATPRPNSCFPRGEAGKRGGRA